MGLAGGLVEVEVDISNGLPAFILVGLPDASLSEATARVKAACLNSGFELPARRITVNLSPASLPKYGSGFDLAIALGLLVASGQVSADSVRDCVFIGELGLDGSIRAVTGALAAVMQAKRLGFKRVGTASASRSEASLVDGITVISAGNLSNLVAALQGSKEVEPKPQLSKTASTSSELDLSDVIGQPEASQALLVAAAGRHNISLVGTPGSGKTMLAERLPGLLPDMTTEQAIEVAAVHSLVGSSEFVSENRLRLRPSFQAPHHSASSSAIIGGGLGVPRPGAISLAHFGVLFLDEVTEFQNHTLQSLREPLESRRITVARSAGQAVFPANFQFVVAANPCPCGNFGSKKVECQCSVLSRQRYLTKLGGPLFDRVDIRLQIQPVRSLISKLENQQTRMTTAEARAKVVEARAAAKERLRDSRFESNAEVTSAYLRTKLKLPGAVTANLTRSLDRGTLSMRGFDRCLRLAWTLADLNGLSSPGADEITLAMGLRGLEIL